MLRQFRAVVIALAFLGPTPAGTCQFLEGEPPRPEPALAFAKRIGWLREKTLRELGATTSSEAGVVRGLQWLVKQQDERGHWTLANTNDPDSVAATSMALLSFLAAGKTHKPEARNPYDENVAKGIKFLIESQDPKTGLFGRDMYAHALATIAICEAYGLTTDPALRKTAERAVLRIVTAQHEASGGWGYPPDSKAGHRDLLMTGWQITALTTAHDAGFAIPKKTMDRANAFLSHCSTADGGFGPDPGSKATAHMTAIGLLAAMQMGNIGPKSPQLKKAVSGFLKKNPPDRDDTSYRFHATQVMLAVGGDDWRDWNETVREHLVKKQDIANGVNQGSWSPADNAREKRGGRLTATCLNLLTLEVYYRHSLFLRRVEKGP